MRSRFRCASVRGLRALGCERFKAILKKLQPETASGNLNMRRLTPFYQIRDGSARDAVTGRTKQCVSLLQEPPASLAPQSFRNSSAEVIRCSDWPVRMLPP